VHQLIKGEKSVVYIICCSKVFLTTDYINNGYHLKLQFQNSHQDGLKLEIKMEVYEGN